MRLGINIDHVATIRNARGGLHPDPVRAAHQAIAAGADGIIAHLREDRRHIRDDDIRRLRVEIAAPLNLEMAATDEMVALALALRPHACCIVPEKRSEITTEGGLDAAAQRDSLAPKIAALKQAGIRVSLFIAPDPAQLLAAAQAGAKIVELHTGGYAEGVPGEIARLAAAAAQTTILRLECHAGHGLTFGNVGAIAALPQVMELNIGHFLIGEALFTGLHAAIREMRRRIELRG